MKKFIIFRTDRLGDFLIITNIITAIKDKDKNSHITLVGSPQNKKIINNYRIIDKVIIHSKVECSESNLTTVYEGASRKLLEL